MTHKIAIGAGHGGNGITPGKRTPDGEYEWTFNDKVVRSAIRHLEAYGFKVLRLDDENGKVDVPLRERTDKANKFGADVLVSVHHNAYTGKWGGHTGTETFIYEGLSDSSEAHRLAQIVQERLVGAYKLKDRGVKKANFHMVRESNMPAILTEGGYMDSTIDIKCMRDNAVLENVGQAIADGVAKYLGVESKGTVSAPETQVKAETVTKPSKPSKPQGDTYKGGSIVDYLNHSGQDASPSNRRKLAREYGVKGYDLSASKNLELLNALRKGKPKATSSNLPNAIYEAEKPYPRGAGVTAVQKATSSVYFYPDKGAKNNGIDGVYGPKTADAVRRFQSVHGLKPDGVYGPKTRAALIKAMK